MKNFKKMLVFGVMIISMNYINGSTFEAVRDVSSAIDTSLQNTHGIIDPNYGKRETPILNQNNTEKEQAALTRIIGHNKELGYYDYRTKTAIISGQGVFINIHEQSQATTPPNIQYPHLHLKLFATMHHPKYHDQHTMIAGGQRRRIFLWGTSVTTSVHAQTEHKAVNPKYQNPHPLKSTTKKAGDVMTKTAHQPHRIGSAAPTPPAGHSGAVAEPLPKVVVKPTLMHGGMPGIQMSQN